MPSGPVVGVVLAAGASSRMGRSKPLLEIDGVTYLARVLGTLEAAGVGPLVIVGAEAERVTREAKQAPSAPVVLVNRDWRTGMLSSLQTAIRHLSAGDASALLLCPVDIPRFRAATVDLVLETFGRTGAPVVVPSHGGTSGHPVLLARSLWPELLAVSPALGARAVVRAHATERREVPVDDPWILRDADTPDEHRRLGGDP